MQRNEAEPRSIKAQGERNPRNLTCLMLMEGFHPWPRIDKHTVPDGYTFGWNNGGTNLPASEASSPLVSTSELRV